MIEIPTTTGISGSGGVHNMGVYSGGGEVYSSGEVYKYSSPQLSHSVCTYTCCDSVVFEEYLFTSPLLYTPPACFHKTNENNFQYIFKRHFNKPQILNVVLACR